MAVRVGPEPPYAFENTDTFAAHYYRVEFKKVKFRSWRAGGIAGLASSRL